MTIEEKHNFIKSKHQRGMLIREQDVKTKYCQWKIFGFLDSQLIAIGNSRDEVIQKAYIIVKRKNNKKNILARKNK